MKTKTLTTVKLLVPFLIIFLYSCSTPDPKAQLQKLRKEKLEIEKKIAELELQVGKGDSSVDNRKALEVAVSPVKAVVFKTYIEVQARVDADESVSLSSEMPGTITKIFVKVGDHVSKGQILAETDSRLIQQQISDLELNYDLAKKVYEKQESLWQQKIGTELQYLQAKNAKESLEKKMATLQEQLRMSKIITPIDGTVDGVNIKLGQTIAPGLNAITVVNFSNLKAKAEVAESYSSRVKTGNEVWVYFPDINDSMQSKVNYAARTINMLSRTFAVEVLLNTGKELHPNMVAKLKINDYESPAPILVLPVKYIQKSSSESFVMVVENGKAVKKNIHLGREYSGMAEVKDGLKEGELMITKGYDLVVEGDPVQYK